MKSYFPFSSIFLVFTLLIPQSVFASGGDRIPGARYQSGRGAALGDAMLGLADDAQDALFTNPAQLARLREFKLEILNFQMQLNSDLISSFGIDFYKFPYLSQYSSKLAQHVNTAPGGSYSLFPNVSFRGFGLGVLYQSRVRASGDSTNLRYRSTYQFIPTAGFAIGLASGVLRFGYDIQWVHQSSGDITVPAGTSPIGYNYYLKQGAGFSHNLGAVLTLPYTYQPSMQFVARNIGGVHYSGTPLLVPATQSTGTIATEDMSIDAGISWLNKYDGNNDVKSSFVYRDFTNVGKTARLGHLSLGFEFGFGEKFFIRTGFASAYPSAGFGMKTPHAEFAFSWFSEETGSGLRSDRDRRYLIQFKAHPF